MVFGVEFELAPVLLIELAFVWIVVFMSFSKVSDSAWILNLAAVLKVGIALVVGGLGIWYAVNFGFANDMAPETFLPALDSNSLTYLSIILFNFMGFEVITTYVGSMENPNKQIPRAIIAGGIAIAALYLFSSFGIGAAICASIGFVFCFLHYYWTEERNVADTPKEEAANVKFTDILSVSKRTARFLRFASTAYVSAACSM